MKRLAYILFLFVLFSSCEKEIDLDLPTPEEKLVVEGHIEQNLPPYVILTRTLPFFGTTSLADLSKIFVRNAEIRVFDGEDTVLLQEFFIEDLPDTLFDVIGELQTLPFPVNAEDFADASVSIYTTTEMLGEIGKTYHLEVLAKNKRLTSVTTIPEPLPLDSVWVIPNPDPEKDTLVGLYVRYDDPRGERNFVRYTTQRNLELPYPPLIQSVFDDLSIFNIDGQTIDIPLERGQTQYGDIDFETYSYFEVGDDITLKWSAIDEAHFNFWLTLEFDRSQTGNPFGRPTIIESNIKGGLGIWGGYGASYYQLTAE